MYLYNIKPINMSIFNSTINRHDRDIQTIVNHEVAQEPDRFLSINKLYNDRVIRNADLHKKMDMVYNYMIKNDIKAEKKSDQKEEKVRKTRKDKEGRKYICGACKLGYLSYPALYTHIKTKHKGETPEGTIRGESGKPKKRGRPKVRKTMPIYEKQLQKNQFPKNLTELVHKQTLDMFDLFQGIDCQQQQNYSEIMSKYFVGIVRQIKKTQQTKIYLLPINKVIVTFLENIKELVNGQTLKAFQDTFLEFIEFINSKYDKILKNYQNLTNYYVNYDISEKQQYCESQRPYYLPVFAQKFIQRSIVQDELQQTLLTDFCKWLFNQQLTDIKLNKQTNNNPLNRQ